jgi:hypothetical protein
MPINLTMYRTLTLSSIAENFQSQINQCNNLQSNNFSRRNIRSLCYENVTVWYLGTVVLSGARIGYYGDLMHLLSESIGTCYICRVAASRIVAPSPRPGVIVSSKKNLLPKGDNTFLYAESKRARVSSVTFRAMSRRIVPCRNVTCHTVPYRAHAIL